MKWMNGAFQGPSYGRWERLIRKIRAKKLEVLKELGRKDTTRLS